MRFCIVGTGRSGTGLLRELLNAREDLFVFKETHFVPRLLVNYGSVPVSVDELSRVVENTSFVEGTPTLEGAIQVLAQVTKDLPDRLTATSFCDRVGTFVAKQHGKAQWADKTPDYGFFMGLMQKHWPDLRFVEMHRDPARVVQSMTQHPGFRWMAETGEVNWSLPSYNNYFRSAARREAQLHDFACLWRLRALRIEEESRTLRHGTFLRCALEDLVQNPDGELERVERFLGLGRSAASREKAQTTISVSRAMAPAASEFHDALRGL